VGIEMNVDKFISKIPEDEKTPLMLELLEIVRLLSEENQGLKDEIARLKGQKTRPEIKPSKLEDKRGESDNPEETKKKRPGSEKRRKTESLKIHEKKTIDPEFIPPGSQFKGYNDYVVQDLKFEAYNVRYRLKCWETPAGEYLVGKLPEDVDGHYGCTLKNFILYQYHHAHVTQPFILEQLIEVGIDISSGQISAILTKDKDRFHTEKEDILKTGLEVSRYINVDDTGARHNGKNGYCTHIGNEHFAYFESTESKSRINFLKILRVGYEDYVITPESVDYMSSQKLPQNELSKLLPEMYSVFENEQSWQDKLKERDITSPRHRPLGF